MPKHKSSHHIPERFLRQLWKHQRFATAHLQTADGRSIEVLSPGKLNHDGGPDFRDARIRIGGILFRGDVEIHQNYDEWNTHLHNLDTKYNRVILHVVFHHEQSNEPNTTASERQIPVLVLDKFLTSSWSKTWERMILDERSERLSTIKCYSLNNDVNSQLIKKWIDKLSLERIELKVRRFEERLKELSNEQQLQIKEPPSRYDEIPFGLNPEDIPPPATSYSQKDFTNVKLWQQILYEGIMEALGYSKNQEPFLRLSRNLRLYYFSDLLSPKESTVTHFEALLFGVADLLPRNGINTTTEKTYVKQLREIWKAHRNLYHSEILAEAEWQFFRLRPENFPTVRLAAAARLIEKLLQRNYFKSVIQLTKTKDLRSRERFNALEQMFIIPADDFWKAHYRFDVPAKKPLHHLIGKSRSNEILLNAVFPICLLYARIFKDKEVRQGTLKLMEHCSKSSQNTITKTLEKQLVKGKFTLNTAMLQQGAIQLYKFYCVEERCKECAVGKVVFG